MMRSTSLVLAAALLLGAGCDDNLLFGIGNGDRKIDRGPVGDEGEGEGDVGEGEGEGEGEGDVVDATVCSGNKTVQASAPLDMGGSRARHAAVLLASGKVLVAGGADDGFTSIGTALLFDPATQAFTSTGALAQPRYDFAMVALDDGRAIAFGGFNNDLDTPDDTGDLATTEIFDPASGTWSAGPVMPEPRSGLSAVNVGGGFVVVFGGADGASGYPQQVLLFDASDDSLVEASGTLSEARGSSTPLLLSDGRVLNVGGYFTSSLDDTDVIFADGRASPAERIPGPRRSACAANDDAGLGLVFGGLSGASTLDDVEAFDPAQNAWHSAGAMHTPRYACEAVSLSCLTLVCGGVDAPSCEAWDFDSDLAVSVVDDAGSEYSGTLTKLDDDTALFAGGFVGDGVSSSALVISLVDN